MDTPEPRFRDYAGVLAGILLLLVAFGVMYVTQDPGGISRAIAAVGLLAFLVNPVLSARRLYRANVAAAMPTSVARVPVRIRPSRAFNALAVTLALILPLAGAATLVALVPWSWLPLAGVVVMGLVGIVVTTDPPDLRTHYLDDPDAEEILRRLCMRADITPPELAVEHDAAANCWSAGGRIHLTMPLRRLLDDAELEAVLAHELAHLAHRDAAVMEICSAPSRVLLGFASHTRHVPRAVLECLKHGSGGLAVATVLLALCIPPAFVIGWLTRLSVLAMSRAREFSADAAAATLTGRPSALASALMKAEQGDDWAPGTDLRHPDADGVLCIVGTKRSGLRRLVATHPPVAARVRRLEATETRIQAGPYATIAERAR